MVVTNTVKYRVEQRVEECYTAAELHYGRTFNRPTWDYTTRGRTAGWAYTSRNAMKFNGTLLMENQDDFIERTVAHEIAHLITDSIYGTIYRGRKRVSHGPEWKSVMLVLGVDSSRCHTYDVAKSSRRSQPKHIYTCNGCGKEMELGPKRHSNQQNGRAKYWMRGCRDHGGYTYQGGENEIDVLPPTMSELMIKRAALSPNPTVPFPDVKPPQRRSKSGSKIARCNALYLENKGITRTQMIVLFVAEAGCTQAGAATYYAKCKKAFG